MPVGQSLPSPIQERYRAPLLVAAAVFLLAFGVELADFGLSIDEEAATYLTDGVRTAISQGRWGIALALLVLPDIGAIPLVSTLLFGVGLLFATWRAFEDFALTRAQAFSYAAVHVAFPVWLHIVQFSTISGVVGIGLAAAVAGARLALDGNMRAKICGALLIAFAVSVYQTLALYCAMYIVFCIHARFAAFDKPVPVRIAAGKLAVAAATLAAGLVLYVAIQKLSLAVAGLQIAYIDGFVQVETLANEPARVMRGVREYVGQMIGGAHSTYLGRGAGVLFLSWLGLLPFSLLRRDSDRAAALRGWLFVMLFAVIALALLSVPTVLSAATLPLRAYVPLPLLAGWLASRIPFDAGLPGRLQAVVVGYFVLTAASISAQLFYTDQVVHNADAAMTQRAMAEIDRVASRSGITGSIPFTLAGAHGFSFAGQIRRSEQFGASFYEQDNGNVYRVAYYMQLQGHPPLQPIWLGQRPDLIDPVRTMPSWPAEGSVQAINGVVVLKLGEPSREQIKGL